nr:immunoglobulin heavy chain junction region [Macaca mulatta]MOV87456.1 immunoglobulin heavy chain junction region [Macaca mulatta]
CAKDYFGSGFDVW